MDGCDSPTSRDSAIKLFGKEIPLMESRIPPKSPMGIDSGVMKIERKTSPDTRFDQSSRSKADQRENNDRDQEKVFKKPDKILPCPRCNSLETKFCYFNNYNVNQPRHFCKNCQRYWTAGGTVRNVPMGSGRRKNKQFASQYRQILVSSNGTPIINMDSSDSANIRNATVLKFGPDAPVSESMDSFQPSGERNRHEEQEQEVFANRSKDEAVNASQKEQIGIQASCNELNTQNSVPLYPLPPWGYPVNQSWNNIAAVTPNGVNMNSNPVQLCHGQFVTIPGIFPQGIPLQFLPASYLACRSVLGNLSNSASMNNCMSPSSSTSNSGGSPTLGKHSREPSSMMEEAQSEKYVLIPKKHIHEAVAKSSVWATTSSTMPKHESPLSKGMVFKGLESKVEGSHLLEADPGVLSRPHTFQ